MRNKGFFVILIILLSSYPSIVSSNANFQNFSSKNLNILNPLQINGDNNFLLTAKVENWSGTGNSSSPIIISNLNNLLPLRLEINDTDLFFNISQNNINLSGNLQLLFYNVSNAVIQNNKFQGSMNGLGGNFSTIINCTNFKVLLNEFSFNGLNSFYITGSSNILFYGNSIQNQEFGIIAGLCSFHISSSDPCENKSTNQNITITNNNFNLRTGLLIQALSGTINENTFIYSGLRFTVALNIYPKSTLNYYNNSLEGKKIIILINQANLVIPSNAGEVILVHSNNIAINNQTFKFIGDSVTAYYCNNIRIENSIFDGLNFDIFLYKSNNSIITNNTFTDTYISIVKSSYDVFSENIIDNNHANNDYYLYSDEFVSRSSVNIYIINNTLNNGGSGIILILTNDSLMMNNHISFFSESGIYEKDSQKDIIEDNTIFNNSWGILILNSNLTHISKNKIYNNFFGGISNQGGNNVIQDNNLFNNGGTTNSLFDTSSLILLVIILILIVIGIVRYRKKIKGKSSSFSRNSIIQAHQETNQITCGNCGQIIESNSLFCPNCGTEHKK